MTSTGQGGLWSRRWLTLPSTAPAHTPWPRVPTTMRSACWATATSSSTPAGPFKPTSSSIRSATCPPSAFTVVAAPESTSSPTLTGSWCGAVRPCVISAACTRTRVAPVLAESRPAASMTADPASDPSTPTTTFSNMFPPGTVDQRRTRPRRRPVAMDQHSLVDGLPRSERRCPLLAVPLDEAGNPLEVSRAVVALEIVPCGQGVRARDPVDEEDAVQVIALVLERSGRQSAHLEVERGAKAVDRRDPNLCAPQHDSSQPGN